jgi:hypothetical protein
MKYATASYNGPNFLSVLLILMGLLFCLPPLLMYNEVPQTLIALVMAVPMLLVGFLLFAQWGTATLQGRELVLKPKLFGSLRSIDLTTVESIDIKTDTGGTIVTMRIKTGGKTITLKRVSPKKFSALVWVAWALEPLLPEPVLSTVPLKLREKEYMPGMSAASRDLKRPGKGALSDFGVLLQASPNQAYYIPISDTMRGPGMVASMVMPVVTYTYLKNRLAPPAEITPVAEIVQAIWKHPTLQPDRKQEFVARFCEVFMGTVLPGSPAADRTFAPVAFGEYDVVVTLR